MNTAFFKNGLELNSQQWEALWPYLYLCFGIACATVAAAFRAPKNILRVMMWIFVVPFVGLELWELQSPSVLVLGSALEVDSLSRMVAAIVGSLACLSSVFARTSSDDESHSEWLAIQLCAVLGLSLLSGARDWISFFVYLETLSICSYILAAMDTSRERSLEAGLKYLLMGAFASGFLLLGVVFCFGATGSFDFGLIHVGLRQETTSHGLLFAGELLILSALCFKMAVVPFHMWAADVYQGAPSSFAAFLGAATKISVGSALLIAFSRCGFFEWPGTGEVLEYLAILTIILGNLLALAQDRLRRMLAYSSIANAGYALMAIRTGVVGIPALLVFLSFYGVALIVALASVEYMVRKMGRVRHSDMSFQELAEIAPQTSFSIKLCFSLALFSLAGIPPLPGFLGKYLILGELWKQSYFTAAGVMLLGSLLGIGYYLRVFVPMVFEKEKGSLTERVLVSGKSVEAIAPMATVLLSILAMLVATLGFSRLYQWFQWVEGAVR